MKNEQLFPTKFSLFIFILYMGLFINQGLIVTASQQADNSYSYNTITVVLLTETAKLISSTILYLKSSTCLSLAKDIKTNIKLLLLYMVPAFLYCLYNNLTFYNLGIFDPTTYFIILQLRVVVTGILFQVIFKKSLTLRQWISLIILTIGCIVKQLGFIQKGYPDRLFSSEIPNNFDLYHILDAKYILIFIQILTSCLAGVYNEKLLKDTGAEVNIFLQNVFMYIDSIFWNLGVLSIFGNFQDAVSYESLNKILQVTVIAIIINNAAVGIVTSFFLRNLNSIMKNFASALELIFTAILSWICFGIAIDLCTILSIVLVIYATYLYSKNPVVNLGKLDDVEKTAPVVGAQPQKARIAMSYKLRSAV